MLKQNPPPTVILATLAISLINSSTLYRSWIDTPSERLGWLLFIIWLTPLWNSIQQPFHYSTANTILTALSLTATLFSYIGSLNAAAYTGLALAFAACMPWSPSLPIWLFGSLAWMPAMGWLLLHLLPTAPLLWQQLLRLLVAGGAVFCWIYCKAPGRNDHE